MPPNRVRNDTDLAERTRSTVRPVGNVEKLLPRLNALLKKILENGGLNERGFAQLDKDLTNQALMRATRIIAPRPQNDDAQHTSSFGCEFDLKALSLERGVFKHSKGRYR